MRVRPYSLNIKELQARTNEILNVPTKIGIEILESLRGGTSGLAVPHFLIESEENVFKVKLPNYIVHHNEEHFIFRNYRNLEFDYINK